LRVRDSLREMKLFQLFRLDTVNYCLWRADERVPITPKAFDVLRYLVEHSQRLVTQDEILEALWPETYVNPDVVKKYVLEIRKVLGDRSDKPVFIETSPRRGYRFVAPVSEESTAAALSAGADPDRRIVGRETALTRLDAHLRKALLGQRQVIFVTGEAGIGKTTLVDVFQERAARHPNLRILRGQCVEGFGGKEAYYPILEALGNLIRDEETSPVVQTLAKRAPTWLIQFPALVKPEQKEALQREIFGSTRERMVREICEALEAVASETPLVLLLEDLHWVDTSTLDVISALARRRGSAKLVVLGTYRPVDVVISGNPLKGLKHDLVVHQLCDEIALEHLEELDIAEYLTAVFAGSALPSGLANLIYRHSGGNALFMVTIVQDIVKRKLIVEERGQRKLIMPLAEIDPGVPDTLQQMLQVQFEQLSEPEQRILKSGSVAGERFSVWDITPTLDIEPDHIEYHCERLADKQQFIRRVGDHEIPKPDGSARYNFRHSLYRQCIYRRLSAVNRSKLHRILGERLATSSSAGQSDLASEIALHFEEGGKYERAIDYLMLTASNAAARFAHRDSIQVLQHALELVRKVAASAQVELEIRILERIGDAYYGLGAMSESALAYERAAARALQADVRVAQINALRSLAVPACYLDAERGIAVLEQALKVSISHEDPLLVAQTQLAAFSSRLLYDAWRREDAEACATAQIVCRLSGSGIPESPFYMYVQAVQGNYEEALKQAEASIQQMTEANSPGVNVLALGAKTLALLQLGRFGEVLEIVRTGREIAEKNESDPWVFIFREAWLRTLCFDFEGVRRLSKIIMRVNPEQHAVQPRTIAMIATGYVELDRDKYDNALQYFAQVRDRKITPNFFLHWYWRMQAELGSARVWLKAGNIANARSEAGHFLESALSTPAPNLQAIAWAMNARVAMAENEWGGAEECIQKALAVLERFAIPVAAWQIHATAWRLYRHTGDQEAADKHRTRARAIILSLANSFAPDEPLRESFLSAPAIRRVLDA
jgi:DNA-binding winged helix-turn-helix (wHTH) protein/tetratricopeptide (TPR) repeat protein